MSSTLRMLTISLFIIVGTCISVLAQGASHEGNSNRTTAARSKQDDIRKLLYVTGADKLGEQILDQMLTSLRSSMKQVPESVWEEIIGEFKTAFAGRKIVELNVPIYSKYYTHDEIRQLISFYESPLGQKVTSVTPLVFKEAYEVGAQYGRGVMRDVQEKLRSKGYKPPITD